MSALLGTTGHTENPKGSRNKSLSRNLGQTPDKGSIGPIGMQEGDIRAQRCNISSSSLSCASPVCINEMPSDFSHRRHLVHFSSKGAQGRLSHRSFTEWLTPAICRAGSREAGGIY